MSRGCVVGAVVLLCASGCAAACAEEKSPLDQRPQPWQRRDKPILSARTSQQSWCQIVCYSPHVIVHDGRFRMWYLGTSEASRSNDMVMGYAESADGIVWREHPGNPILTGDDVLWGRPIQTPFVMHDADAGCYRMWFVSGAGISRDSTGKIIGNDQQLGHATSPDGINWKVAPQPLYPSGRSPGIVRMAPDRFRMWMNSRPRHDVLNGTLYKNIYEFSSPDGLTWTRGERPVLEPSGEAQTVVYPFVIRENDAWYMWYGSHLDGGTFEIFCARSNDGSTWETDHSWPAFPRASDRERFDSRYTSTPCVVRHGDRLLLYYSARDWQREYVDAEGRKRRDGSSVYAGIGVAELQLLNRQQ